MRRTGTAPEFRVTRNAATEDASDVTSEDGGVPRAETGHPQSESSGTTSEATPDT